MLGGDLNQVIRVLERTTSQKSTFIHTHTSGKAFKFCVCTSRVVCAIKVYVILPGPPLWQAAHWRKGENAAAAAAAPEHKAQTDRRYLFFLGQLVNVKASGRLRSIASQRSAQAVVQHITHFLYCNMLARCANMGAPRMRQYTRMRPKSHSMETFLAHVITSSSTYIVCLAQIK